MTSQAMPLARGDSSATRVHMKSSAQVHLTFIDNIRVLLVILVILHHPFLGGLHWQALAYALLEQFMCMGMVISLLVLFRRHNHQGRLVRELGRVLWYPGGKRTGDDRCGL